MAESRNPTNLDGSSSVSALGLRWAALRGMLASPLIEADEQRSLREELLRELQAIEHDFATLPARNPVEIGAKIRPTVKTALRNGAVEGPAWLADLLDSVQAEPRAGAPRSLRRPHRASAGQPVAHVPAAAGARSRTRADRRAGTAGGLRRSHPISSRRLGSTISAGGPWPDVKKPPPFLPLERDAI